MLSFLTDLQIDLLVGAVAFAAGVVLSQKVKDKIAGIPAEVRAAASSFEASALNAVSNAKQKALADLSAALPGGTVAKAAAPAPAAAPAAPAPVEAPAAPAAQAPAAAVPTA